jgi:hypothetical protein
MAEDYKPEMGATYHRKLPVLPLPIPQPAKDDATRRRREVSPTEVPICHIILYCNAPI